MILLGGFVKGRALKLLLVGIHWLASSGCGYIVVVLKKQPLSGKGSR
jgi:hypothetical protein